MRSGLRFGEVVIAGDAATGIIFDRYSNECEARLDGECIRCHPLATVCARALAMQGVHLSWSFVSDKPATVAAAPEPPSTPAPVALVAPLPASLPAEPVTVTERRAARRVRCWYGSIRRFYAVYIEQGLPTDDAARRAALGRFVGRGIASRSELTAGEWLTAGDAIRRGALAW